MSDSKMEMDPEKEATLTHSPAQGSGQVQSTSETTPKTWKQFFIGAGFDEQIASKFEDTMKGEDWEINDFKAITEGDLKELGFKQGPRRKILNYMQTLSQVHHGPPGIGGTMDDPLFLEGSEQEKEEVDSFCAPFDKKYLRVAHHLKQICGLKIPHSPTQSYVVPEQNRARIAKDACLPAAVKDPTKLDFRLLPGNLGDQKKNSPVVSNVLKCLENQDTLSFSDLYLFLAVSGGGKSKAGFDILQQRWGLFLDMTGEKQGQPDIGAMLLRISDHINSENFESKCRAEVELVVLVRVIVLLLWRARGGTQPRDWLFMQLNGLYSNLTGVHTYFTRVFRVDDQSLRSQLHDFLELTLNLFLEKDRKRFICFIDESHILLSMFKGVFNCIIDRTYLKEEDGDFQLEVEEEMNEMNPVIAHSQGSGTKRKAESVDSPAKKLKQDNGKRALFTLVMDTLASLPLAVISAGTAIRLKDKKHYASIVAKSGVDQGSTLRSMIQFHHLEKHSVQMLLERFIDSKFLQSIGMEKFHERLVGRVRFTIHLIQRIIECPGDVNVTEDVIEQWLEELKNGTEDWALRNAIKTFKDEFGADSAHREFANLIIHFIAFGGIVPRPTGDPDLQVSGLTHLLSSDRNKLIYRFAEPLIFESLLEHVTPEAAEIIYFMERINSPDRSASAIGDLLDLNVSVAFICLNGTTVYDFIIRFATTNGQRENIPKTLKQNLFKATKVIGTGHRESLRNSAFFNTTVKTDLKSFIKKSTGCQYYIPGTMEKPASDGCQRCQKALFLVANKFSGDGNVSASDVDKNAKTTSIADGELKACGIDTLIRLHVVLPCGAKRETRNGPPSHVPGVSVTIREAFTEIVINIDNTNLKKLFPERLASSYKSRATL